jgi:hypothetical protein
MYVCIHANMLIFCRTLALLCFTLNSCGNARCRPWQRASGIHAGGGSHMLGILPAPQPVLRPLRCGLTAGASMPPQNCACKGVLPLLPALLRSAGCPHRVHTARLGCARTRSPVVAHPTRGRPARRGPAPRRTVDRRLNRSSPRVFPSGRKNRPHRMPHNERGHYTLYLDPPPSPPGLNVNLPHQLLLPPTPTR